MNGGIGQHPTVSPPAGRFPATEWSLVLCAADDADPGARQALERLCLRYWYPLYAYVRRFGRSHHESEDCTQEFIARLLASGAIARARPERGRFRGFLLTALRNFLVNEWTRSTAAKRGGGAVPLSLDFSRADQRFAIEPIDPGVTPEQAFDRAWVQDMISRSLASLRSEYTARGAGLLFAALEPVVLGLTPVESLADAAPRLGMSSHALTMALHRLRSRLGRRLRDEVCTTVAGADEVDDELRHLIAAVGSGQAGA